MTGHTAMHAVPKTAKRLAALLLVLATLLALFGGLSIAPKPAHAASYTMSFDANGGTFPSGATTALTSDSEGKVTASQLQAVSAPTHATVSGKAQVFTGWWSASTGGTRLDMHGDHRMFGNETWYAHWTHYTVTFDLCANPNSGDGATCVTPSSSTSNEDGHFTSGTLRSSSHPASDPSNHVYNALGPTAITLDADSQGRITAAQIASLPEAFRHNAASSGEYEETYSVSAYQYPSAWKTSTGFTLPTSGFTVNENTRFVPTWDTATVLSIFSTNSYDHDYHLHHASWPAQTWPEYSTPDMYTASGNGMKFDQMDSAIVTVGDDPIPNTEVRLLGKPGDVINIQTWEHILQNQSPSWSDGKPVDGSFLGFSNFDRRREELPAYVRREKASGIEQRAFHDMVQLPWYINISYQTGFHSYNHQFALFAYYYHTRSAGQYSLFFSPKEGDYNEVNYTTGSGYQTNWNPPITVDTTTLNRLGCKVLKPGDTITDPYAGDGFSLSSSASTTNTFHSYLIGCNGPMDVTQLKPSWPGHHFLGWFTAIQGDKNSLLFPKSINSWRYMGYIPIDDPLESLSSDPALEYEAHHYTADFGGFDGYLNVMARSVPGSGDEGEERGSNVSDALWGWRLRFNGNGGYWNTNTYEFFEGTAGVDWVDPSGHAQSVEALTDANNVINTNMLSDPIRPGYKFLGWNSKSDGSGIEWSHWRTAPNMTVKASTPKIWYARWKENPKITFDPAPGSFGGVSSYVVRSDSNGHVTRDQLTAVPTPTLRDSTGRAETFDGWYLENPDGSMSNTKLTVPTAGASPNYITISGDETYVAEYSLQKFSVTFNPGAGGHVLALTALTPSKGYGMQPKPTWTEEPDSTAGSTYTASEDADHPFTVQASKDSNLSGPGRVGGTYTARLNPDSSDHSYRAFLGWSTEDPASHSDATSHLVSMPDWGDQTGWFPSSPTGTVLYAVYSDVRFDLNDSTGRPAHLDWNFASPNFQQFPTAHRTGFVFQGWTLVSPTDKGWTGTCIPGVDGTGNSAWGDFSDCGNLKVTSPPYNQVPQDSLWRAKWTPVTYRVKLLDSWEDPRYAYYTSPVGSGIYNKTGKYFGSLLDPTIDVQEDATADANGVNTFTVWLPSTVSTDSSVVPSTVNYAPYRLTGWASYASATGYDFPDRVPFDWAGYQAMRRTHTPSATYTDIQTSGSHRGMIPYTITVQPSDYQVLSTDNTEETSGGLHSWLEPMRAFDLYGLFEERSVKHLPSAGGTAWSLLLMLPLLLLLLVAGAWIARRRSLVPVAPTRGPLHVAPRARHAA